VNPNKKKKKKAAVAAAGDSKDVKGAANGETTEC